MDAKRIIGLSGLFLLCIGMFLPAAHIPILGRVSFLSHATTSSIILSLGVFISFLIILKGLYKWLWFTASGCAATMITTMHITSSKVKEMQAVNELECGTVELVISALATKFQWDIGIVIMSLGVLLLFTTAGLGSKKGFVR